MNQSVKNTESFRNVQHVFTQHMRDPENNVAPIDVEDRRLKVYRELVYNNIEGFIANSFPVLRKIIADKDWHMMLRDYVARHKARTPLFTKMPQEFLHYLQHERQHNEKDHPCLLELAHYEWIETALAMDSRKLSLGEVATDSDLLEGVPVISCLVMPLTYRWPVHKISIDYLPDTPPEQTSYLMVYRNKDDVVGFMELNLVSAKLIELCLNNPANLSGRKILLTIAAQLQHQNPDIVIKGGLEMMYEFKSKDIILGTKK